MRVVALYQPAPFAVWLGVAVLTGFVVSYVQLFVAADAFVLPGASTVLTVTV